MKALQKITAVMTALVLMLGVFVIPAAAEGEESGAQDSAPVTIHAKSAVLLEVSTGRVLYEMNAREKRAPASITKVMTALLTMEALDAGRITLDDMVTASANAKAMGGTTIHLDDGEQMSVNDLLKGMMVNSANDAAVALGEYIGGTQEAFVQMMNDRAQQLGMVDTHFVNCHGLDADGHETTAYDIGLMSVELLRHPKIMDYTKIWVDTLRNGTYDLANTNRLIRFYEPATGLKTGTTDRAGRCVSASAMKEDLHLVAVVLAGENKNDQFEGAKSLLEWGFANWTMMEPEIPQESAGPVKVLHGLESEVKAVAQNEEKLLIQKNMAGDLVYSVELAESVEAPVESGQLLGHVTVSAGKEQIAEIPLTAAEGVERMTFGRALWLLIQSFFSV